MNPEAFMDRPGRMQPEEEDQVESGDEPTDPGYPGDEGEPARSAHESIAAHLAERGGDDPGRLQDLPAGGAGADAGAGQAAHVDPASHASIPDESTHNDEPGIGTRRADADQPNRDDEDSTRT